MSARVIVHNKAAATTVVDANQLNAVLEVASEEARSRNILGAVIIEAENGNSVTIVVGGDETVLTFDYGHRNPPYYASKGKSDKDEPVLTCYLTFQHHSEFPRKNVIPYGEGAKAVAQFLDSGKLPTCIGWVEV
jgi:Immunity protein Imm1